MGTFLRCSSPSALAARRCSRPSGTLPSSSAPASLRRCLSSSLPGSRTPTVWSGPASIPSLVASLTTCGSLLGSDLEYSWGIAWVFYICFVVILCLLRDQTRKNSNIIGNIVEDFFCCLFGFYNVLPQMMEQPYVDSVKKDDDAPV